MNSRKKFRRNTKKNKTRNMKHGGGEPEDQLFIHIENNNITGILNLISDSENIVIDTINNEGNTPLHIACKYGYIEVVNILIENGGDINMANGYDSDTPLHLAISNNHLEVAMDLIKYNANINATNSDQSTPLHLACLNGNIKIAMALIEKGAVIDAIDNRQNTPLHIACNYDYFEVAMALIEKGAAIDAIDNKQNTPLHIACNYDYFEVAMALIEKGAAIDARNSDQDTPLHRACNRGHIEVAMYLIEDGADMNARNKNGDTPLHEACVFGRWELVNDLIEAGANKNIKNNDGNTPSDFINVSINNSATYGYALPIDSFQVTTKSWKVYSHDNKQDLENLNGRYKVEFPGGDIYKGDWANNMMHGKGNKTSKSGDIYRGCWQYNKMQGKGKLKFLDGDIYKGDFYNGLHGDGTYIWNNGDIYVGEFKHNKMTGKGTMTFANGNIYEGDFEKSEPHGKGKYTYAIASNSCPAGSTYEGYWKNHKMETEGNEVSKLTWPAHDSSYPDKSTPCGLRSFEGKWINDIPQTQGAGYEDIPMILENWGNYVWRSHEGRILLDRAAANAYEVHQKGSKMKQKLDPVLKYIEELTLDVDPEKTQELIQEEDPQKVEDAIFTMFNDVGDLSEQQKGELVIILNKLGGSQYITDRNSKEIIIKCVVYATNINIHDLSFIKYYINIFIEENIHAYNGPNGISCTAGIFERFFTVLQQTINLALQTGSYTGNDPKKKQERLKQYNEILNKWGLNKPDMSEILATFNGQHESILSELLEGKKQPEKVRKVIEFIKAEYLQAGQEARDVDVEGDLDEYLQTISINRDGLFAVPDSNAMFGGKRRKNKRKTRRRIQKKIKNTKRRR